MPVLTCPVCGLEAGEASFRPGGESHLTRPPEDAGAEALRDYLYMRENKRGIVHELWLCRDGCSKWFHAARDTITQEFHAFYRIGEAKPYIAPSRNRRS